MIVQARHDRNDDYVELNPNQISELVKTTGIPLSAMFESGVYNFSMADGWTYQLFDQRIS